MIIKINGREEAADKAANLKGLIAARGLVPEHIVVEYNSRIAPSDEWAAIALKENDNIEIVSFVGGG